MSDEELDRVDEEVSDEQADVMQAFIHATIRLADALRKAKGKNDFQSLMTAIYGILTSLSNENEGGIQDTMLEGIGHGLMELGLMPDVSELSTLAVELATTIRNREQTKEGGTN